MLGCGCLCNQLPSRQPPRSSGGRLSRASSPLANRAAQGSRRPHPADAPRAKGAKRSPLRLLQGSGNLESSPTRHTRDRLLKVVPAAARVSLHRLVNPPRAPQPRPLSGLPLPPPRTSHSGPAAPATGAHRPAPGARDPARGRSARSRFHRGPEGAGRAGRRTELELDAVNPTRAPTGKMLSPPGGLARAAGCIHPRDPLPVPQAVVLGNLDIQGPCSHTRRAAGSLPVQGRRAGWPGTREVERWKGAGEVRRPGDTIGGCALCSD